MSVPNTTFRVSYIDGAENVAHIYCASADEAKQVAWGFIKNDIVLIRIDYKHEGMREVYVIHRLPKLEWSPNERWGDFEHVGTYRVRM